MRLLVADEHAILLRKVVVVIASVRQLPQIDDGVVVAAKLTAQALQVVALLVVRVNPVRFVLQAVQTPDLELLQFVARILVNCP